MADLFDWSATAANNTTLDGISVATGMSPGNVDNAIRSLMALIRNTFVAGWEGLFAGTTSGIPVSNGSGTISTKAAPTGDIVGTTDTQTLTNKTISGGTVSGITDLAIADGGTGAGTQAGAFANIAVLASSLANPGYIKFPNGFMVAWGTFTASANTTTAVNYAAPFPTASFPLVNAGRTNTGAQDNDPFVQGGTATVNGFTVYSPSDTANAGYYIAVGY